MPSRRPPLRFWYLTIFALAVLALFPLYTNYKRMAAPVPPGVHLAGVDVSFLREPAAIEAVLAPPLQQPIGVRFQARTLVLRPEAIDFRPDFVQTIADAAPYLEGFDFVDIAVREAIGLPQQRRDVALRYTVDEAKLRAWLEAAATLLNYAPAPPRVQIPLAPNMPAATTPLTATGAITAPVPTPTPLPIRDLAWSPGAPGYEVNVDASIPAILAALARPDDRVADLALLEQAPPPPAMADLEAQLPRVLDTFPVFTAIDVHDLTTGESAQADGDAAFSAMETLRVALGAALMEALPNGVAAEDAEAQQAGAWLDRAIGQGDDAAANAALAWLGGGDQAAGARRLTEFMQRLGFQNSFMQAGFGAPAPGPALVTPSNQRKRPNTRPDANAQTTPSDLARLMGGLYECTEDKGLLRTIFPGTITPDECRAVLFYMTHNELRDSLWRGLPEYESQWIVHQHGLSFQQHGNVALVWGPTGPYAISIFIYNPGLTDSTTSNAAIRDLSRMIWDFFAFRAAEGGIDPGPPPELPPPPGYQAVDSYAPSTANPRGQ